MDGKIDYVDYTDYGDVTDGADDADDKGWISRPKTEERGLFTTVLFLLAHQRRLSLSVVI